VSDAQREESLHDETLNSCRTAEQRARHRRAARKCQALAWRLQHSRRRPCEGEADVVDQNVESGQQMPPQLKRSKRSALSSSILQAIVAERTFSARKPSVRPA